MKQGGTYQGSSTAIATAVVREEVPATAVVREEAPTTAREIEPVRGLRSQEHRHKTARRRHAHPRANARADEGAYGGASLLPPATMGGRCAGENGEGEE